MSGDGPVGPVDATKVPRYAGPPTFARLPRLDQVPRADVAVVGVPFDSGVSYRPGARFGPQHIRQARGCCGPTTPSLDVSPFAAQQVADAGDIAANPFDIDEAIARSRQGAEGVLENAHPAADPRRRPHHRAAAAAHDGAAARPARGAALRRAPRHLGHLLRRAVHARDAVPPRLRGGPDRPRALAARRHPRAAVRRHRPRGVDPARLRHGALRRLRPARPRRGDRGDARAARRRARSTSRSTST